MSDDEEDRDGSKVRLPWEYALFRPDALEVPDDKTTEEVESLERRKSESELAGLQQYLSQQKLYPGRIFCFTVVWMVCVLGLIAASGMTLTFPATWGVDGFDATFLLPESVQLALLGTTTLNVVGLFMIVAKYLFPSKG